MAVIVKQELRFEFSDGTSDISASEYTDDSLGLEQDGVFIVVPKEDAAAFASALMTWISTGGKACAS